MRKLVRGWYQALEEDIVEQITEVVHIVVKKIAQNVVYYAANSVEIDVTLICGLET
jgi:hypothetical protein